MSHEVLNSSNEEKDSTLSKSSFPSDMVIPRPTTLDEKCPIESRSKHFPMIDATRKKSFKSPSVTTTDSLEFWLKPGISLPKLHSKVELQERIETSESVSGSTAQSLPPLERTESLKNESLHSLIHMEKKSQSTEVPESVVGPSTCRYSFRVPSSEFDLSKCKIKDKPTGEFHALTNWRMWNKEHKKQEAYLSKNLKKKPQELLLQKSEAYRKHLENKIMLGMWSYPVSDKWRGNPSDWTIPVKARGKKRTKGETASPEYFLEKTNMQKGNMPELEFIITPNVIKMEKELRSLSFDYHLIKPNLRISDAVATAEERIKSLLKARNRMRPPSDIIDALAIVGTQISQPVEEQSQEPIVVSDLPVIEVTPPEQNIPCKEYRKSVFCLVIDGKEIKYEIDAKSSQYAVGYKNPIMKEKVVHVLRNEEATSYDYIWEFTFGLRKVGQRLKRVLKIENRGTVAVRYDWAAKKLDVSHSGNKVTRNRSKPCFFFDKNSGIFLPGQFYYFDFYFRAETSGAKMETWYLKMTPGLGKNVNYATIIFSAVASDRNSEIKSEILENYLREQLRHSIVRFSLNVIFQRAMNITEHLRDLEYQSMFFEKQLFEYHNPKYYYHSDLVEELNVLFETVASKEHNHWDFSLDTLITLISTTPKLWNRALLLQNVSRIAKKLLKPSYVFSREEKKYRLAYNILCKMVNCMEEDHNYLRKILSKRPECKANNWGYGEYEEAYFGQGSMSGEKDESDGGSIFDITSINLKYLQTMFYIKVYHRVSEALENIADMVETRKRFERLEKFEGINYKSVKPPRSERQLKYPSLS